MTTCTRCGLVSPDSSERCECGGPLVVGDVTGGGEGRVAGFWIRLGSDLLDALVLGVVGVVISFVFRASLLRLGEGAIILGAPITLLYCGVLQSQIGGGQTLAKRLLGLRVLRLDGRFLSLDRSLVRWSITGLLWYGGAIALALGAISPIFDVQTLSALFGGVQLALVPGCALLVPFHPLKRGLHDLLTGSIVIRGGRPPDDLIKRLHNPRRDRFIVGAAVAVAALAAGAGIFLGRNLPPHLVAGTRVMKAITELGLQNPGVADVVMHGPNGTQRRVVVSAYLPTDAAGVPLVSEADSQILALVRKEMPLDDVDGIVVKLRKGINLGIYSSYETTTRVGGQR